MSNVPTTNTGLDRFFHYLSAQEQVDYLRDLLVMMGKLPLTTEDQERAAMLSLGVGDLFPRNEETESEHERLMDKIAFPEGHGQLCQDDLIRLADISSVGPGMPPGALSFVLKRRLSVALDVRGTELDPRVSGQCRA